MTRTWRGPWPQGGRKRQAWLAALWQNLERALREGRWPFALRFCEELLQEDPHSLPGWLVRGHLAWKYEKDLTKAIQCYQKVIILGGYEKTNQFVAQAQASLAQLLEHQT